MNRTVPIAALLGAALLVGCATRNMPGEDDGLVERVRQELAMSPLLNSTRVNVTERDGVIVVGGFVESLEDVDVVRDVVMSVEDVVDIENNVIVQTDEDDEDLPNS